MVVLGWGPVGVGGEDWQRAERILSLTNFWKLVTFIGDEQMSRTLLVLMCLCENLMAYCCSPQQLTSSSFITSLHVQIIPFTSSFASTSMERF